MIPFIQHFSKNKIRELLAGTEVWGEEDCGCSYKGQYQEALWERNNSIS